MTTSKFRLVTRSDFDGLAAAVLLRELDMIDEICFVHPKDMQDGKIKITSNDITTNLPYVEGVHLCFDHHLSEANRVAPRDNHIIIPDAPSAARVVYEHFGGDERFSDIRNGLMEAVDQADSAQYDEADILAPSGWTLLNFIMDPRTGLGRFRTFTISNYQLMMDLVLYCRHHSIEEILALPDVEERVQLYLEHAEKFEHQLRRVASMHDNRLVELDLRNEDIIYAGNRFMVYALYPEATMSMHVLWGLGRSKTVFALGKSILNRSAAVDISALTLSYGGGGHEAAGTCQIENDQADTVRSELIGKILEDA
ncbi:MAG: exopolyphosphatase [Rhodospirillaceae bacterium]